MGMKRRSTEPGLGTGGLVPDAPISVRDLAAHERLDEVARRSSAPPPSAAVPSRRTTALESSPSIDELANTPPAPASAPPAPASGRPLSRTESTPPTPASGRPLSRAESTPPKGRLISRPPISRVSDPPPPSEAPRSQRVLTTPPESRPAASSPPKASKQSFRSSRPAIRVDDTGTGASKMVAPRTAPRVVKGANLKNAKIDSKDAFVLSLIDGKLDVPGIVDVAGLPGDEVARILERLEGLGLVKLS